MSSSSHTCNHGLEWVSSSAVQYLRGILEGFFKSREITKTARIFHGEFSYGLVPNTAITDFHNMNRVTSLDSGDCYICIFDEPRYQGQYRIVGPGERAEVGSCGSIIISTNALSINAVRDDASPPAGFWELSGPMYLLHFSPGYRYV